MGSLTDLQCMAHIQVEERTSTEIEHPDLRDFRNMEGRAFMMMYPVFKRCFFPFPQHQQAHERRRALFSSFPGYPLVLAVNKSPAVVIFIRHLDADGPLGENRSL